MRDRIRKLERERTRNRRPDIRLGYQWRKSPAPLVTVRRRQPSRLRFLYCLGCWFALSRGRSSCYAHR